MTAKQRAKIYRKAAEFISNGECVAGCSAITAAQSDYHINVSEDNYPEFWMFNFKSTGGCFWWYNTDKDTPHWYQRKECRILALLLSAEIALNP